MPDSEALGNPLSISTALCVGGDALTRFGRVVRHLVVGLVDQAVPVRLLSCDARAEALALGPVQTLRHEPIRGPWARWRLRQLMEALEGPPPTVVHALSGESYGVAQAVAETLDADLVIQVTSVSDCIAARRLDADRVAHWIAFSEPLSHELVHIPGVANDVVELVRPAILASVQIAYGAAGSDCDRTLVCTSPLVRGGGVDRLVDALAILKGRGHELLAFLLGEGPHESVLRQAVRERGLSRSVTFSHPGGEISQALHSSDVFVWPTVDDSFTADTLAAMGAGLAVVTLPSPICDHFHAGQTAALCPSATAEALAETIGHILVNPDYGRRIAQGGWDYVRAHHAVSTMAERIAGAYRKLALPRATFPMNR